MNGAELLIKTALASGIEVCFTNPGTTEMPLVLALDGVPGIRTILGLFEGVCTGAADGYGRMTGKPAMTLVHLGPGFANGVGNLHNARRARTPVLNLIGEHATWHRAVDPPLHMDIEALTAVVSGWHRTCGSVETISGDVTDAIIASLQGQISSLIVPHDHQLAESKGKVAALPAFSSRRADEGAVEKATMILRQRSRSLLMLGGRALSKNGLAAAARIKAVTGCDLFTETFPSCWERGAGLPVVERTLYQPGQSNTLREYPAVILAGMEEPVTFMGLKGFDSRILGKDQEKVSLAAPGQDVVGALERLADALSAPNGSRLPKGLLAEFQPPALPGGKLTVAKACQTLAALQPEGAIVVDEGITSSSAYLPVTQRVAAHTMFTIGGGSLGWGMPCAIGAAVACPDRPVIGFQGDGSTMYTVQALWTQAREALNITTLVLSNRSYHALQLNLDRFGITSPGPVAKAVTELERPSIGWVKIAQGLGVPAVSVATAEELAREIRIALAESGPHLIEMVLQ